MNGFKGKWDFEADCGCAKCENHWNMLADCVGDARSMEEGGASPDRPVKGWRLDHRIDLLSPVTIFGIKEGQ